MDHLTIHFHPTAKQERAAIYLMGNHGRIFGFSDDDYNSNDHLMNDVEHKNPNVSYLYSYILSRQSFWGLWPIQIWNT